MLNPVAAQLVARSDRWLLAFAVATLLVLALGTIARQQARLRGSVGDATTHHQVRGLRRRAGALLGLGPLVGWLVMPTAGHGAFLAAAGAVSLAVIGAITERWRDFTKKIYVIALIAAVVAVAGGARFAPTGVGVLDVIGGILFVFAVIVAMDGLGNADGLVSGLGLASAVGVLALAAFPGRLGPANVAAGLAGACLAFLAFNLRPASLFAGRGGRLAVGYALAVTALEIRPAVGAPGSLMIPLLLVAIPLFDLAFVAVDRLRRRRRLTVGRRDHLYHRFLARDATETEAVMLLVGAQVLFVIFAVFGGRGVVSMWVFAPLTVLLLAALGGAALQGKLDRIEPIGFSARATGVITLVGVVFALIIVPVVLTVPDVANTMQDGRKAAERGLAAARNGDTADAAFAFRLAAQNFDDAARRMNGTLLQPARVVPGLAPNVRAARTLAQVGRDLSHAGEDVSVTVIPENLTVVNGRVDLAEVERVTPSLERAATALEDALGRVRDVADDPYLLSPVRKAARQVRHQLAQSAGEARRTATAAKLAPAIFGGDGTRRYLLVVQNNAEARATGGFIGSYGVLTADDGDVDVGKLLRTSTWNAAVAKSGVKLEAPEDYVRRYGQFAPERILQNVNLSPDFPAVAGVLMSLTEAAGVGKVDGVMAIDPKGLAALLELTGPVNVSGWPTPITAANVVDVTLRDAYQNFAQTPDRADFLGDVAQVVVDEATSGELGKPAQVARVLGSASHEGHIALAFARPDEQRLARQLAAHGGAPHAGRRDVFTVTTSNVSANKLDYYLRRVFDYRLSLDPDAPDDAPNATAEVSVNLRNTAPASGLPQIVAGPYDGAPPGRFRAGELLSSVSVYTPLDLMKASVEGQPVNATQSDELGGHVIFTQLDVDAQAAKTLNLELAGRVPMQRGGWYELDLGHQASLEPDRARVSVEVPDGWRIDKVSGGVAQPGLNRAVRSLELDRPRTVRIHVVRDGSNLWERLKAGK